MINYFTKNVISATFENFIKSDVFKKPAVEITIEENEYENKSPYYSVLSFRHKRDYPIDSVGFRNITGFPGPLKTKSFVLYDVSYNELEYYAELEFLTSLQLAFEKKDGNGKKIYIHKFASILYGVDGLFNKITAGEVLEFEKFLSLMYYYVLPGRYWRSYYNSKFLSTEIAESIQHTEHMTETEFMWKQIDELLDDLRELKGQPAAAPVPASAASNPFSPAPPPVP
jgi:hypothetical protein